MSILRKKLTTKSRSARIRAPEFLLLILLIFLPIVSPNSGADDRLISSEPYAEISVRSQRHQLDDKWRRSRRRKTDGAGPRVFAVQSLRVIAIDNPAFQIEFAIINLSSIKSSSAFGR